MTEIKKVKLTISGDKPVEISDDVEENHIELDESQKQTINQLSETIKVYIETIKELLTGKYAHLKDWAPIHLSDPGNILIAVNADSVVLRFERKSDGKGILAGWFPDDLSSVAPLLSQGVLHCYSDKKDIPEDSTKGVELHLLKGNSVTKKEEPIASIKVGFDIVVQKPEYLPKSPSKPYCLLSINNTIEIIIKGIMGGDATDNGKTFLTRTAIRLPVGWECIEIYPFFHLEQWKPELAVLWAENDLLAAVVASQFRENYFQSLDPKAAAREQYAKVLKNYKDLLDSNPEREEILQIFLHDNPELLCPTKIKMWPKLALGNRKTDFVLQEATNDYILVELEQSTHSLFNKDGHMSQPLNHAHGQILDWKRYLEDNLSTVQRELGLTGISTNPKSLIVIGRSQYLTPDNRRKLTAVENESPKLKVMTYDDVYESAKSVIENLLGPLWETTGNTRIYYTQQ